MRASVPQHPTSLPGEQRTRERPYRRKEEQVLRVARDCKYIRWRKVYRRVACDGLAEFFHRIAAILGGLMFEFRKSFRNRAHKREAERPEKERCGR